MSKPGSYQLIDFDSSVIVGEQTDEHIQPELYRAPEVILQIKPYSPKIDVFSLGVILYELYTGERMFATQPNCNEQLIHLASLVGSPAREFLDRAADQDLASKLSALPPPADSDTWLPAAEGPDSELCGEFRELMVQLLQCDPSQRPSAADALRHRFCQVPPRCDEEEQF